MNDATPATIKVVSHQLSKLTDAEKAAVLDFCVGYGLAHPLVKSADAALLCLRLGVIKGKDGGK